ncbi:MAG: hypothetical protein RMJ51_04240 [Candidatus Calescibacterium sp.]|nr:hypothetical protein [Candidatus Calescibacterium sp.]MDW8195430.1 hypothetical protein [Candidatus Calescibacterium sp.]
MSENNLSIIHSKIALIESKRKELKKKKERITKWYWYTFFVLLFSTILAAVIYFLQSKEYSNPVYIAFCMCFLIPTVSFTLSTFLSFFFKDKTEEEYKSFIKSIISPSDLQLFDLQVKDIGKLKISSVEYIPQDIRYVVKDFSRKPPDKKNQNKNIHIKYNSYSTIENEDKKMHIVSFSVYIPKGNSYKKEFSCIAAISKSDKSKAHQEDEKIKLDNSQLKYVDVHRENHTYRIYYHYINRDVSEFSFSVNEEFTMQRLENELKRIENYFICFFYSPDVLDTFDSGGSEGSDNYNGSDAGVGYY